MIMFLFYIKSIFFRLRIYQPVLIKSTQQAGELRRIER